jgi:hypothetical protein
MQSLRYGQKQAAVNWMVNPWSNLGQNLVKQALSE